MSYMRSLVWYLLAGTRGSKNRARIVKTLKERPCNANQLSEILKLDYKTVRHHLKILIENKIVIALGEGRYGTAYTLSEFVREEFDSFSDIWREIEED